MNSVKENNFEVIGMIAYYLINHPDFINKDMINELVSSCNISEEEAFFVLFCSACGLDDCKEDDKYLINNYFRKSIKRLNISDYTSNPYYKNILVEGTKFNNWEIKYESYKPYEAFIYNDLIINGDIEIPCVGYFKEEFKYLAVLENNNEWMMITPNEINTMQGVIDSVSGDVVTLGLGLGYFAYMASLKDDVKSITVVERDKNVIELFSKVILPRFEHKDKIKIVNEDAFEFAKRDNNFDYAFVDLWHDVSDGVNLYLKMKKLEKNNTKYFYWIEKSIISKLKWDA